MEEYFIKDKIIFNTNISYSTYDFDNTDIQSYIAFRDMRRVPHLIKDFVKPLKQVIMLLFNSGYLSFK